MSKENDNDRIWGWGLLMLGLAVPVVMYVQLRKEYGPLFSWDIGGEKWRKEKKL